MQGADPAALRRLASRFDQRATELQQLSSAVTAKINGSDDWKGPDADRFRSDWNGAQRTRISQAITALHDGSKALAKNADEQERASGDSPATSAVAVAAALAAAVGFVDGGEHGGEGDHEHEHENRFERLVEKVAKVAKD